MRVLVTGANGHLDTSRIRTELGLQPRSAEETIRDTARWLGA